MATDVPVTLWQPTDGNGEFSSESANDIVDPSDNNLVDPSGNQIVDTGVIFTPTPATVYVEDDDA